jgi:hypothetical protein
MNSIGDFAESLILGEVSDVKSGKISHPKVRVSEESLPPTSRDISKIEVPESFRKEVLGESYTPVEPEEEVVQELEEEVFQETELITEDTAQEMVSLLKDVRNLLIEMSCGTTTAGGLGVNLAGPTKKPKKRSKKSAFKDALRSRRR